MYINLVLGCFRGRLLYDFCLHYYYYPLFIVTLIRKLSIFLFVYYPELTKLVVQCYRKIENTAVGRDPWVRAQLKCAHPMQDKLVENIGSWIDFVS